MPHRYTRACLTTLVAACSLSACGSSEPGADTDVGLERITAPAGRFFTDTGGRVRIFRGVDMAARGEKNFAQLGFGAESIQFLAERGINIVRLGVTWANLEPEPDQYDEANLADVEQTIRTLAENGIYTVLDLHMDQYSQLYGDGAPGWATVIRGTSAPDCGFPENLRAPLADCRTDINEAYTAFYGNESIAGAPLWDHYEDLLVTLAGRFSSLGPALLGFEVINEPWPGMTWEQCFQDKAKPALATGCVTFNKDHLAPFYEQMLPALRAAAPERIVFYEPDVLFDLGGPILLPKFPYPDISLAVHVYDGESEGGFLGQSERALTYANSVAVPVLVTEFGATVEASIIERSYAAFDATMLSASEWTYSNHAPFKISTKPGSATPPQPAEQSIVVDPTKPLSGDNVHWGLLEAVTRPYPAAVAGTPKRFEFDPKSKLFSLEFSPVAPDGTVHTSGTEVVIPVPAYPGGYTATISGGTVTSGPNARVLKITAAGGGDVSVEVRP